MIAVVFVLVFLGLLTIAAALTLKSTAGVLTGVILLAGALVWYEVARVRGWL